MSIRKVLLFVLLLIVFPCLFLLQNRTEVKEVREAPKTILLWSDFFRNKNWYFGLGSEGFEVRNCSRTDCFMTRDKNYVKLADFDSIVFHGAIYDPKKEGSPYERSANQIYVYFNKESPIYGPVNFATVDNFYNMTATYRLDSDIVVPYFHILDMQNELVAPREEPNWIPPRFDRDLMEKYEDLHRTKSKPVAWFTSHCHVQSERLLRVRRLQKLINVDIYGKCGNLKCPRNKEQECFDKLRQDYFFYLSFENSNCQDYITEKLLNALRNDVIPIVSNGVIMKKFLPPGSYIDAFSMSDEKLVEVMKNLMENPAEYAKYFWWKNYYKIESKAPNMFCRLCEILHDNNYPRKSYGDLQTWWHGKKSSKVCPMTKK